MRTLILRPALLGIALFVGLLLSDGFQTAEAADYEYLVENSERNPAGGTSSGGLVPTLWGVQPQPTDGRP